jgi:arylsulfatase A-like enzyme
MSLPGKIPAAKVCPTPVGGTDLPPTFFSLIDLPLPWDMHGHDLTPLLQNPEMAWERPVLTVLTGEKYGSDTDVIPTDPEILYKTAKVPWWVSLMEGRHKYVRTLIEGEVEEFYDLEADPEELVNLALKEEFQPRLRKMRNATIEELKRTKAGFAETMPRMATEN